MESPLGPGFANIFVGFNEQKPFKEVERPAVCFFYVDDKIVVFESDCDLFH